MDDLLYLHEGDGDDHDEVDDDRGEGEGVVDGQNVVIEAALVIHWLGLGVFVVVILLVVLRYRLLILRKHIQKAIRLGQVFLLLLRINSPY